MMEPLTLVDELKGDKAFFGKEYANKNWDVFILYHKKNFEYQKEFERGGPFETTLISVVPIAKIFTGIKLYFSPGASCPEFMMGFEFDRGASVDVTKINELQEQIDEAKDVLKQIYHLVDQFFPNTLLPMPEGF